MTSLRTEPSGHRRDDVRLGRLAMLLAVAAAAVRLVWAGILPPFPDETYYWEWSRHLAWGYFDHPPAIAWLIRGGTELLGSVPLGLRLLPVTAGLFAVLACVGMARRLGGGAAALRASAILACLPLAASGLVLATPDAPLLAATGIALYALVRAVQDEGGLRWWVAAGAATGLGFLAKYTAVLIPVAALAGFVAEPRLRVHLRLRGPYVAAAVASALFIPVVAWNAHHGWASFEFQLHHGLGSGHGSLLAREAELIGGQLGLASPILFVLLVAAVARGMPRPGRAGGHRGPPRHHAGKSLLGISGVVFLGFFVLTAARHRVEANWPAQFYAPAAVLLALESGRRLERWFRPGLVLGALLVALAYVHALRPILPLPPERDPAGRADGWDVLASAIGSEVGGEAGQTLAATRYQDASELSFHLPGQPFVPVLDGVGRRTQYGFWSVSHWNGTKSRELVVVTSCSPGGDSLVADLHGVEVRPPTAHVRVRGRRGVVRERCLLRVTKP